MGRRASSAPLAYACSGLARASVITLVESSVITLSERGCECWRRLCNADPVVCNAFGRDRDFVTEIRETMDKVEPDCAPRATPAIVAACTIQSRIEIMVYCEFFIKHIIS